jgi:hypothetical protein
MQKLAILLLLACAACTTRADGPPSQSVSAPAAAGNVQAAAPAPASSASGTLRSIHALIGKASCLSDNQCQVLPIGAKSCGGPAGYLAWSNVSTDGAELQALAERYKTEQQADNERAGRISTCRVLPQPPAACRANICQLVQVSAAR